MDLQILVSDKNLEFALRGILSRDQSLGIRPVDYEIEVHSGRDGGVRTTGTDILALEQERFSASLMLLDFEGSGTGCRTAIELEQQLDIELQARVGVRSKCIVIDPECDAWVWGSDNSLSNVLRWDDPLPIRQWLRGRGFELSASEKPLRPKEAMAQVFRKIRKPRSSASYQRITSVISLDRCTDAAFGRLRDTLQTWFPIGAADLL